MQPLVLEETMRSIKLKKRTVKTFYLKVSSNQGVEITMDSVIERDQYTSFWLTIGKFVDIPISPAGADLVGGGGLYGRPFPSVIRPHHQPKAPLWVLFIDIHMGRTSINFIERHFRHRFTLFLKKSLNQKKIFFFGQIIKKVPKTALTFSFKKIFCGANLLVKWRPSSVLIVLGKSVKLPQ